MGKITDIFNGRQRMITFPDNYKTVQPYLIYFAPGSGECNAPNPATDLNGVDLLYNNGSPCAVARDGKLPQFVVVSMRGSYGLSVNAWEVFDCVKDVIKNYNINPSVILMTGLSAGGGNTCDVLGFDTEHLFTAGVEMSCPGTSIKTWVGLTAKLLGIHGTADEGITSYKNSINVVNAIWNTLGLQGYSHYIPIVGATHNLPWSKYYDPATKLSLPGFPDSNMYDWGIASSKDKTKLFTDSGTGNTGGGGTIPPPSMAKPVPVGSARYDAASKTIILTCNKSTGLGTFGWAFKAKPPAGNMAYFVGGSSGDATMKDIVVAGAVPGDWIFTLSVWNGAGTASVDVPLTATDSGGGGTNPPVTPTLIAEFDITTVSHVKEWSDGTRTVESKSVSIA